MIYIDSECYLLTALAFGLTIVAMAYSIGNISGCHINPAVSIAMLIRKKMSVKDFVGYVISQCVGAFVGCGILAGGEALSQLWIFVLAPLAGSALAAAVYEYSIKKYSKAD